MAAEGPRAGPGSCLHLIGLTAAPAPCTAQPVMLKTGFVQRVRRVRGEKALDDALARELGAMGLL